MDLRRLTDDITVAPQIEPSDIPELARMGFRMLIDNRPDIEVPASHSHETMRALAEAEGMEFRYIPFHPGHLTADMVQDFAKAMDEADGPVMAWCRSGTRSTTLWSLSQAGRRPAEEILSIAAQAGYDMSQFTPLLRGR